MSTSSNKVSLDFVTGKINSAQGSGKMYVFHAPHRNSPRYGSKEDHFTNAVRECPELADKLAVHPFVARTNIQPDIGGRIFTQSWQFMDGEVLKVWAQRSTYGEVKSTGSIFLRLRSTGAFNELQVNVPKNIEDSKESNWWVRGRFDVLSVEEAEALGVAVLDSARYSFHADNTRKLFKLVEKSPELKAAATFEKVKAAGSRKAILIQKRRRKLRLD